MDKRYQIFVSSTYEDLKYERQEVIKALLNFDCIPVGMEFFPAANDSQWEVISKVIRQSDYYVVIVAGRYGSLSPEGISYTQKEYEFAIKEQVPVIAFLHQNPGDIPLKKSETSEESRLKLETFRALCEKRMCNFWKTRDELARIVMTDLIKLMKSNPRVGWVRADQIPKRVEEELEVPISELTERIEKELPLANDSLKNNEKLEEGGTEFDINFSCSLGIVVNGIYRYQQHKSSYRFSWNKVFAILSPFMMNAISSEEIKSQLEDYVLHQVSDGIREMTNAKSVQMFRIERHEVNGILIKLRLFGLITKSNYQNKVDAGSVYWALTSYGDSIMSKIHSLI